MRIPCVLIVLALLVGVAFPAWAQQLFVSEVQEISLRSGPSMENKTVQMIKSGSKVEKLRDEGEWSQVRAESGREGWVLKRYLTADAPVRAQFEEFKIRNAEMIDKAAKVEAVIARYEEEAKGLQKSLATLQTEHSRLKSEYDTLAKANANVAEMTKTYHEAKAAQDVAHQEAEKLKRENDSLRDISDVKWFLAGAGVLLGGWFFGYMLGRSARRKSGRMLL